MAPRNPKAHKGDKPERVLPEYKSPPPQNAREKKDWDRMSTRMEGFHSYFRTTFQQIWQLTDRLEELKVPMSAYIKLCEDLNSHLTAHHGIEEQYIFPVLAKRMPEFGEEHPEEHQEIHAGMDRFMAYITKVKSEPSSYSSSDFQKVLSSWGPILMHHLDAEVKTLSADNLRRYYTLEEVRNLPM